MKLVTLPESATTELGRTVYVDRFMYRIHGMFVTISEFSAERLMNHPKTKSEYWVMEDGLRVVSMREVPKTCATCTHYRSGVCHIRMREEPPNEICSDHV